MISVFATYWNEKDWIEASLAQIDLLEPDEVWLVDGCFDTQYENKSTDGTREIITQWVAERPHAHMISAIRKSRLAGLWCLFFAQGVTWWNWPLRIALFCFYLRTNPYRINQACTFTYMLRNSKHNKPDDWIMHSDADQFYPDEMIEDIKNIVRDDLNKTELLTANEMTFFTDFNEMTTGYEKRNYNNMPYRIRENTIIIPTRDVVLEQYPKPKRYLTDSSITTKNLGNYFHYKFRPNTKSREAETYQVGDRKPPNKKGLTYTKYTGKHPSVVGKLVANN